MSRVLVGTVEVRDGAAVCVTPAGTVYGIGGKPATFDVAFGGLRPYDAGKRIYNVGGTMQMENDDQLKARLAQA